MPQAMTATHGLARRLLAALTTALLCLSGARGQNGGTDNPVIGVDICACQPATYEFVLDFDLTCRDQTVGGPGINDTACVINTEQQVNVTDFRPLRVTTIQILELNQDMRVIAQTPINGDFRDGDSFRYTSVIASIDPATEDPEMIPKALQITLNGRNAEEEDLVNFFLIIYDNNCGVFPVVLEGQQIGWTIFNDLGIPPYALCPAIGPPSVAPHPSLRPSPSSSAPTRQCVPRPLPKKKQHPSGSGSKGGTGPSKGHGSKLAKPKHGSGSKASKGSGSKSAHASKGSTSQASKAATSGSSSWNHTSSGSIGWGSGSGYNDTDDNSYYNDTDDKGYYNETDDNADDNGAIDGLTDDGADDDGPTADAPSSYADDVFSDYPTADDDLVNLPTRRMLEEAGDFVMQNVGPHPSVGPYVRSPSLSPLYYSSSSSSSKGSYSRVMSGSKASKGSKGGSKHASKSKAGSGSHDPKTGLPYCDDSNSSKAGSGSKASKGGSNSKGKGKGGSATGGSTSGGSGSGGSGSVGKGKGGFMGGSGSLPNGSGSIPNGSVGSSSGSSGNLSSGNSGNITSDSIAESGSTITHPPTPIGPYLKGDGNESSHETSQHNIFGGHERKRRKS